MQVWFEILISMQVWFDILKSTKFSTEAQGHVSELNV